MTFEEAKKRIADCVKLCTDDYNRYEDEFMRGEAAAYKNALATLDLIEPVGNPDKLTLKELARELRKIFRFNYLTYNQYGVLCLWTGERPKPENFGEFCFWNLHPERTVCIGSIDTNAKDCVDLDLSEYADENGNVDYSKCIVEVTDASE